MKDASICNYVPPCGVEEKNPIFIFFSRSSSANLLTALQVLCETLALVVSKCILYMPWPHGLFVLIEIVDKMRLSPGVYQNLIAWPDAETRVVTRAEVH